MIHFDSNDKNDSYKRLFHIVQKRAVFCFPQIGKHLNKNSKERPFWKVMNSIPDLSH